MAEKKVGFSKTKVWFVFVALFVCGLMAGVGIANWKRMNRVEQVANTNVSTKQNVAQESEHLIACQAIEHVLLGRLYNEDYDCNYVKRDLDVYKKLVAYGCDENRAEYAQQIENKNAILSVACGNEIESGEKPCVMIEKNLQEKLGREYADMRAEYRIERAKIYAIMAERGCPENASGYVEAAKRELEIARGISDDKFDQEETIEVVETYKRLQMQNAAEEIFEKAKKLTNPAIDFIMQVEKIINE